jgi:hypothetical protein
VRFRDRLLETLRAVVPVLEEPGVVIVGSEVPNLLEPDAAATLVVSQDVDVGVPVSRHAGVKRRLDAVRGFRPSPDEPSVWVPDDSRLLEVNFVGMDESQELTEAYALDDDRLPLMVFGPLALVREGERLSVGGFGIPLPRPAGLLLEKLVTDRTGEKGERDLLVALGLLLTAKPRDVEEVVTIYATLSPELRHTVRSNLTILSLLRPRAHMPDPERDRGRVLELLRALEGLAGAGP